MHKFFFFALLAVAGILGTLARYGLSGFIQSRNETLFPWGTVVINLLGCLLFGFVWSGSERWSISGEVRSILLIGFMGAFTTFSTYIFETERLLHDSQWQLVLGYFAIHNIGGLAAILIGLRVGRFL